MLQFGKILKTFGCNCYHKTQPLLWPTGCSCHNHTISSYCSRFLNAIVFILVLLFPLFQTPPGSWASPWVRGIAAASPQMRLQTAVWPFTRRSSLWTHWWRCRPRHSVSNFWVGMLPDLNLWNFSWFLLTAGSYRHSDWPTFHLGFRPLCPGAGFFQGIESECRQLCWCFLSRAELGDRSDQPTEQRLEVSLCVCVSVFAQATCL